MFVSTNRSFSAHREHPGGWKSDWPVNPGQIKVAETTRKGGVLSIRIRHVPALMVLAAYRRYLPEPAIQLSK